MTTPADHNRDHVTVITHMRAATGKEAELRAALQALAEPTAAEDGCLDHHLHESTEETGLFYVYENWDSEAQLDAHLAAPHLAAFTARIPDLVDVHGATSARLRRLA